MEQMRALLFDGALRLARVPVPAPASDEALLKVRKAGICNTDLEITRGYAGFRGILGHEFVAEVTAGAGDWVGRRVVGEINIGCRTCDFCMKGIPSQCRNRRAIGIHGRDGAFAEYLALPLRNLHLVPDSISDDRAVFVEPLAAALQVIEGSHISPRDRIVLIGAGKLGMLVAQVLKLTGADISVIVRREQQARLLEGWGIRAIAREEAREQGYEVVVECTGNENGLREALKLVQPRGTVILKSTFVEEPAIPLAPVVVREIRVIGSRCGPFDAALNLLRIGMVDVESLISARYGLDDALAAFEQAAQKGVFKVLVEI